ncbi:PREDICTED: uncharacterized protein LOC105364716 [Ceratosolen solmsi marchali]|uniref:Male-enhanced antigen 1 n=1 Tax=Ceratosolen solmsi marchali TaxID=326594 RepID=A0AAJ6YMY8_9HYME|nr:PREDICTED: uncharacterized protein LOC105364716 [Ceratosolen solmsi marchali]
MSPEPTQEPIDNVNNSNINVNIITGLELNNDNQDAALAGYMPLSDNLVERETLEEDDSEEEFEWDLISSQSQQTMNNEEESLIRSETLEVWSSQSNTSNIDLDADKINQVKTAMASFILPNTAIPQWANYISEDQWKEQLILRIKEIQKK